MGGKQAHGSTVTSDTAQGSRPVRDSISPINSCALRFKPRNNQRPLRPSRRHVQQATFAGLDIDHDASVSVVGENFCVAVGALVSGNPEFDT